MQESSSSCNSYKEVLRKPTRSLLRSTSYNTSRQLTKKRLNWPANFRTASRFSVCRCKLIGTEFIIWQMKTLIRSKQTSHQTWKNKITHKSHFYYSLETHLQKLHHKHLRQTYTLIHTKSLIVLWSDFFMLTCHKVIIQIRTSTNKSWYVVQNHEMS